MTSIVRIAIYSALLTIAFEPAGASENYGVYGSGNAACGSWAAESRQPSSPGVKLQQQAWILGWLSAQNSFLPDDRGSRDLVGNADAVFGWIDRYCATRPLERLSAAAERLVVEFGNKWLDANPPSAMTLDRRLP